MTERTYHQETHSVQSPMGALTFFRRSRVWWARKRINGTDIQVSLKTYEREEAFQRAYAVMLAATGGYEPTPEEIPANTYFALHARAKKNALQKGVVFDVTREYVHGLGLAQNHRCLLTGHPFSLDRGTSFRAPFGPSLDRIIPARGYTPNNLRLVCTAVNWAMSDWGAGVFDVLCRGYVRRNAATENRFQMFEETQ